MSALFPIVLGSIRPAAVHHEPAQSDSLIIHPLFTLPGSLGHRGPCNAHAPWDLFPSAIVKPSAMTQLLWQDVQQDAGGDAGDSGVVAM